MVYGLILATSDACHFSVQAHAKTDLTINVVGHNEKAI